MAQEEQTERMPSSATTTAIYVFLTAAAYATLSTTRAPTAIASRYRQYYCCSSNKTSCTSTS